jgi:hypothetical protein
MGFVHKTWSGGYRTYIDGDNVRLGRGTLRLCFSRVEAWSLGFGFAFHFFADVLVRASSRCFLLCSLLTSFLPYVFGYHFRAGITVFSVVFFFVGFFSASCISIPFPCWYHNFSFLRAGHRWEARLVSSTCLRRTCSFQSIVSIHSLLPNSTTIPSNLKSVHEKGTHTCQTPLPTPPLHPPLLPFL